MVFTKSCMTHSEDSFRVKVILAVSDILQVFEPVIRAISVLVIRNFPRRSWTNEGSHYETVHSGLHSSLGSFSWARNLHDSVPCGLADIAKEDAIFGTSSGSLQSLYSSKRRDPVQISIPGNCLPDLVRATFSINHGVSLLFRLAFGQSHQAIPTPCGSNHFMETM